MKNQPSISLNDLVAGRLTFAVGNFFYVYDSRGYKFARCPMTGDIGTEPSPLDCNTGIFFGAYDDGYGEFFSFWEADCFDPPQYLIRAKSWETAYDIFLEEFGTKVDVDDSDYDTPEKIEEAINNGSITYTSGGTLVHCDGVNGRELKLIKAENFQTT